MFSVENRSENGINVAHTSMVVRGARRLSPGAATASGDETVVRKSSAVNCIVSPCPLNRGGSDPLKVTDRRFDPAWLIDGAKTAS